MPDVDENGIVRKSKKEVKVQIHYVPGECVLIWTGGIHTMKVSVQRRSRIRVCGQPQVLVARSLPKMQHPGRPDAVRHPSRDGRPTRRCVARVARVLAFKGQPFPALPLMLKESSSPFAPEKQHAFRSRLDSGQCETL